MSAAFNGNDDVILEIVKRLPLKHAAQCSVLNKNIRRSISDQPNFLPHYSTVFHCSGEATKIFTSIWQEIRSTNTVLPRPRSVTLDMKVSILSSCNGLLLLRFEEEPYLHEHYVFNPTTSAVTPVGQYILIGTSTAELLQYEHFMDVGTATSLAVPENSNSDSLFKLVLMWVHTMRMGRTHLEFTIINPKLGPSGKFVAFSTKPKPIRIVYERIFKVMTDDDSRPVNAHGSLYWLGDDGMITVAFDVEKEEVRLIDGPVERSETNKWFGLADGAVHFVYAKGSEIVICRHDHLSDKWHMKQRISKCWISDDDAPLFFDGRRILFVLHKRGEGGDVYRYDLVMDSRVNIESLERWSDYKPNFFSYTSTYAKVSNTYLTNNNLWYNYGRKNAFLGLQKLNDRRKNALLGLQKLLRPAEN